MFTFLVKFFMLKLPYQYVKNNYLKVLNQTTTSCLLLARSWNVCVHPDCRTEPTKAIKRTWTLHVRLNELFSYQFFFKYKHYKILLAAHLESYKLKYRFRTNQDNSDRYEFNIRLLKGRKLHNKIPYWC